MTAPYRTRAFDAPVTPFHVVIIGGGIGGLTLAQGLKKPASVSRSRSATGRRRAGCKANSLAAMEQTVGENEFARTLAPHSASSTGCRRSSAGCSVAWEMSDAAALAMRAIQPGITLRGLGLGLKITAPLDSPQCRASKNAG